MFVRTTFCLHESNKRYRRNEELYGLYFSPRIIRAIKSRRMRWAGNVARVVDRRGAYSVLVGRLRERDRLEDLGIERTMI